MTAPNPDAVAADIDKAIADVLAKHETGFTTKWVALIETVDGDGAYGLWTLGSDDTPQWDVKGMLYHALHTYGEGGDDG